MIEIIKVEDPGTGETEYQKDDDTGNYKTIPSWNDESGTQFISTEDARRLIAQAAARAREEANSEWKKAFDAQKVIPDADGWHDLDADKEDKPDPSREIEVVIKLPSGDMDQIHWKGKLPIGASKWIYTPKWKEQNA